MYIIQSVAQNRMSMGRNIQGRWINVETVSQNFFIFFILHVVLNQVFICLCFGGSYHMLLSILAMKQYSLTHWGWVTHICISKLTIIGSDNGLSPGRLQAIIWTNAGIYIIISKNICYLLWNRGARRFFHDTYLTIEVQGIRCTNHLHDSCSLTDVNPHFTAPGCRYYFKINSWWPIVTSSTHGPAASYCDCDVTMIHCSHGYLWTHDVDQVDAS